jgi:hypothetical protein
MKKFIAAILIANVMSNAAFAECDFKTGITANQDGSYTYTKECHVKVGQMKNDLETAQKQLDNLGQAITLKDLALQKSDDRVNLWMQTSSQLEDRITKLDSMQKHNEWIYFGLGVLTTLGAGFMTARILGK